MDPSSQRQTIHPFFTNPTSNEPNNKITSKTSYKSLSNTKGMISFFKYLLVFLLFTFTSTTQGCDIWKASDCMGSITGAEEEFMKSDDYTKEQLYKYCDKGKAYVDCINSKLKCCDLKPELRGALAAYDKQLERQAWKLGPYCAGIGESNVVKYKCRTTTRPTTTTATKSTKPTLAPCQIEKVRIDKHLDHLFLVQKGIFHLIY
jgi:hypothetical protein